MTPPAPARMTRKHLEDHMAFITNLVLTAWDERRYVESSIVRQEVQLPHDLLENGDMIERFVLGGYTITIKLAANAEAGYTLGDRACANMPKPQVPYQAVGVDHAIVDRERARVEKETEEGGDSPRCGKIYTPDPRRKCSARCGLAEGHAGKCGPR